jgi:hypothetical protein
MSKLIKSLNASMSDFHRLPEIGPAFSDDLLQTASACAMWIWGQPWAKKFYHLCESHGPERFPFFHIGSQLAVRKSVVKAFLWSQEVKAFESEHEKSLVQLTILLDSMLQLVSQARTPDNIGDVKVWMMMIEEILRAIQRVQNTR